MIMSYNYKMKSEGIDMYKRVLVKVSGEALGGGKGKGLDFEVLKEVAQEIKMMVSKGVEVGIVVGRTETFGEEKKVQE